MLLTSRYVIPVSQEHPVYIEYGAVLVQGDRIAEVGTLSDLLARHPDEEVRDFGMAAIMPGFVDCHTHLEFSLMRGILNDTPYASWKAFINEKMALLTTQDWFDSAYMGAYEALTAGITTVADVTSTGASLPAVDKLGLRGIIYRGVGAPARSQVEQEMARAREQIAEWGGRVGGDRVRIGIAPENLFSCHPQILKEVAAFAKETGTPVAIHLAGSQEECDFIRYGSSVFSIANDTDDHRLLARRQSVELLPAGCSPVQYALNWDILDVPQILAIHCVKVDDHDIEILRDHGVSVAVTPRACAKLGQGLAPIVEMRRAGIPVGLGSDSPAASDSMDPIAEMRFAMLALRATHGKEGFIEGPDMIAMATIESARALGIDDLVGSLDVGKKADIIAVDLSDSRQAPTHFPTSAVVHTSSRDDVVMTMVDGNVVYDAADKFCPLPNADIREMRRITQSLEGLRRRLRS